MHHPQGRVAVVLMRVHWRVAADGGACHHVGMHGLQFGSGGCCCQRKMRGRSDHGGDCSLLLLLRGWRGSQGLGQTMAALHGVHQMSAAIMHVN